MATNLPAKLRRPDLSGLAARAQQLDKYDPVVAYWCRYRIVQLVLGEGLHQADPDCETYVVELMGQLEKAKEELAANSNVTSDIDAQVYIQDFADKAYARAEKSMLDNTVTALTADTLRAAATFLDILHVWTSEPRIAAQIKYAKFHALRIAKALKAGEDPNASNPVPQEPEQTEAALPALDPEDPEVQNIQNGAYQQPSVQSAPPSPVTSDGAPRPTIDPSLSHNAQPHDVSPLSPPVGTGDRKNSTASQTSAGGGYFPRVPTFTSDTSAPNLPTAPPPDSVDELMPTADDLHPSPFNYPPGNPPMPPTSAPDSSDYYSQSPAPPVQPSIQTPQNFAPPTQPAFPMQPPQHHQPQSSFLQQPPQQYQYQQPPVPIAQPVVDTHMAGPYKTDEDSITSAQKHAKWAMSALNFEDVDTAVQELRKALADLGAR